MCPRLVIPQGDFGGIGPEVALKAIARPETRQRFRPLLIGHLQALQSLADEMELGLQLSPTASATEGFERSAADPIPVLELETSASTDPPGRPAASFGLASVEAVLRAGSLCRAKNADAMVTPPIHKESMHLAGYAFEGQTQILGELSGGKRYGMLACNGDLKILLATRHMALREALEKLEITLVSKQIRVAHEAARDALGLENPRIALAGLNPHAGEGGAFGKEEIKVLRPAILRSEEEFGFKTTGPVVPDVVFAEAAQGKWDVVIALYHDQAFIPLKLLGRDMAWTVLVGAPGILRTSPMHGAAYDIARTGVADENPFLYTLERTLDILKEKGALSS